MQKSEAAKLQKSAFKSAILNNEALISDAVKTQSSKKTFLTTKHAIKMRKTADNPIILPLKKALLATVMLPVLTFVSFYPAHAQTAEQSEKTLLGRAFSFAKKKEKDGQIVQLINNEQASVTDLQKEVRELTGQIEELNHTVSLMQEQIKQLQNTHMLSPNSDNAKEQDFKNKAQATPKQTGSAPFLEKNATSKNNVMRENNTIEQIVMEHGALQKEKNASTAQKTTKQATKADLSQQETPQGGNDLSAVPETENAKELYALGYSYILSGDYRAAESVFVAFQQRYPDDALIADASFWLGEALFGQKRYREAAQIYIDVQRNYSDSPRGPENLLKLGMSMSQLDEQKIACETFAKVTERYDNVQPAVLKRVKDEQNRNKCS